MAIPALNTLRLTWASVLFLFAPVALGAASRAATPAGDFTLAYYGEIASDSGYDYVAFSSGAQQVIAAEDRLYSGGAFRSGDFTREYVIDASAVGVLSTIDPSTGIATIVGETDIAGAGVSMSFDSVGNLYATEPEPQQDCAASLVYAVDPTSGSAQPLIPLEGVCVVAMAIDVDDLLYFLDATTSSVFTLTASGMQSIPLGFDLGASTAAMVADPVLAVLWVFRFDVGGGGAVYRVDPNAETMTAVGALSPDVQPMSAFALALLPSGDGIFIDGFELAE